MSILKYKPLGLKLTSFYIIKFLFVFALIFLYELFQLFKGA